MQRKTMLAWPVVCALALGACSGTPHTMLSPSAVEPSGTFVNPDGSTLKVGAPRDLGPNGVVVEVRPTLGFTNAVANLVQINMPHEIEIRDGNAAVVYARVIAPSAISSTHTVETNLAAGGTFTWRVRGRVDDQFGPWSAVASFQTLSGPGGVAVGTPRNIGVGEAVSIIRAIYSAGNYNIGSRSSPDQRRRYLQIAVAVLHFGHSVWNSQGPDSNWCLKNGGGSRPQSDDVIARCNTREAWDLVRSMGGSNPVWSTSFLGRLPSVQTIYPPPAEALGSTPQP